MQFGNCYGTGVGEPLEGAGVDISTISNIDTSSARSLYGMFSSMDAASLDLSNLNTSKAEDTSYMFAYCSNLETIDISNMDTSKVTNSYRMFYNSPKLKKVYVNKDKWTLESLEEEYPNIEFIKK